jgi:putative endonuclease
MGDWYVYMVRCSDGSLYTGIAKDVERRIDEHNNSDRLGSRYTRTRKPVTLVYQENQQSRSSASRREAEIKRFSRQKKEMLIAG